jgi:hypothetical protein
MMCLPLVLSSESILTGVNQCSNLRVLLNWPHAFRASGEAESKPPAISAQGGIGQLFAIIAKPKQTLIDVDIERHLRAVLINACHAVLSAAPKDRTIIAGQYLLSNALHFYCGNESSLKSQRFCVHQAIGSPPSRLNMSA